MSSYRTGSLALSRDLNRVAVLRLIGAGGPIARAQIAQRLGLSPATVTSVTRELLEQGVIQVVDRVPSKGGRPAMLLEIVGSAATAVGVKVAPDHLVGVRVNLDADVVERFESPLRLNATDAPRRIGETLTEWLADGDGQPPLLGVGLGVPGIAHPQDGTVDSTLLGWRRLPLISQLEERVGVPVLVDNDVNTLAIAERLYGRARNVENFITVTIGAGVGLGIVAGGDIYHGFAGGAGEFGHVAVVEDGRVCSCGKRGCLETLVSDPALVAQARAAGVIPQRAGIARLRRAADGGDAKAVAVFAEAGRVLGRAVSGLVNVLSPELVLISGEGTQSWPHMAKSFDAALRENVFRPLVGVQVEVDPWDDAKWAVGAAALVLRSSFTASLDSNQPEASFRARLPRGVEVVA
jgi:predicted NBD/HSP70 family sugar kinase